MWTGRNDRLDIDCYSVARLVRCRRLVATYLVIWYFHPLNIRCDGCQLCRALNCCRWRPVVPICMRTRGGGDWVMITWRNVWWSVLTHARCCDVIEPSPLESAADNYFLKSPHFCWAKCYRNVLVFEEPLAPLCSSWLNWYQMRWMLSLQHYYRSHCRRIQSPSWTEIATGEIRPWMIGSAERERSGTVETGIIDLM